MDINHKHFLITGGSAGIGFGLTQKLIQNGARVTILDLQSPPSIELESECLNSYRCDISDSHQVDSVLTDVFNEIGPVDCLVNNAGIMPSEPLVNLLNKEHPQHSLETWDKVISINLTGPFLVSRKVATHMASNRIKGLIINVSSICAQGNIGQTAYSASKAGLEAMTHVWAKELNTLGIRCCCLAPGFVDTVGGKEALNSKVLESWISQVPLRRLAKIDELVHAIFFLIENDFFNDKVLRLDGGLRI